MDDLPLFELFNSLRQAGLPLGIDEYHLLLHALQYGFGIVDQASLQRVCKNLWVKTFDEERLFDYHFKQVMSQSLTHPPLSADQRPSSLPSQHEVSSTSLPSEIAETVPRTDRSTSESEIFSPHSPAKWPLNIDDEVQVARAIQTLTIETDDNVKDTFIHADEYFPITRRQMKQSWRYLRRPIREGPPVELDIETTISEIGRQGIFLEPVLVPRRINRTELLLLIDQDGSMVPFHALSLRLAQTALRGGRLEKTNIYYFRNCPVEYCYVDPAYQKAISIKDVLHHHHASRAGVMIFSDAGASRGGFSPERIAMTENFLEQLKHWVRYIVWLNPMPHSRWPGTTAAEIMHLVPMFDVSRQGLDAAISVLRGKNVSMATQK